MKNLIELIQKLIIQAAYAQAEGLPGGPSGWKHTGKNPDPAELQDLEYVFHRILSGLFFGAGLVAFVYLVIGGFKYITAGQNEDRMEEAKNTLTYAILGLVVAFAGWLIISLMGQILGFPESLGEGWLQFTIPSD